MPGTTDSVLAAHPIDIYRALDKLFSPEAWLAWDPDTILLELKDDISDAAVDKVLSVQAVASNTAAVLRSAAAFEKVVNAFCNSICVMDVIQPPEVEEMSYAVSQIAKIANAVHGDEAPLVYTGEVPGYVASVAHFRGWFMLPKNLSFGQELLDHLTGHSPDSAARKEHQHILDVVSDLVSKTSRADAREIIESSEVSELESDSTATLVVKRLLGSLLYDPTLQYRQHE